jgi:hypothetical protein
MSGAGYIRRTVEVSQIVIRSADGTPLAVAAEYGPRGA